MAKLGSGGKPPLFDRLSTPEEGLPPNGLGLAEIRMSIQQSLHELAATRSARSLEQFLAGSLTTLDWGIPDFGALSPANESDRRLMAKVIERAIGAYEPRLTNPLVRALPAGPQSGTTMRFEIQATVRLQRLQEQLTFSLGVTHAQ